ncbi:hypothetical protein N7486_003052 [Penicillium sp. IBT 16267x]|nr:hypothetical protein N7486_003052 [Penicillium sp. IBT 16267x]
MDHIQNLPVEILNRIFTFILGRPACPMNEKGSFANIRPIDEGIHDEDPEEEAENLHLEIRPALGEYVKEIEFMHLPFKSKPKKLAADDAKLCKRAIQALGLGDEEKRWISLARNYDFSVLIALVVVKLPNLRALRLEGDLDGHLMGYNLAIYEDFFTRPRLQHLTLEYCHLDSAAFPSTWTPGSLAAETLFIRFSRVDSGAFRRLMQACKKLTMFAYQNFDPRSGGMGPQNTATATHFTPAQALEAARPHKETLEYFHLELARSPSDLKDIQKYLSSRAKFGSFREFSALETLMVPHAYIPVHPELPRSLKQIDITDCNSSIQNMAQNIAKDAKKGLYPDLRDVRVLTLDVREPIKLPGGRIPLLKTPADCFLSLQELFEGTEVNFQICPYIMEPYGDDEDYDDYDLEFEDDEDYDDYDLESEDDEFQIPGLGARRPLGGNEMPPEFLQLLMQEALLAPDFPHPAALGVPRGARGPSGGPPGRNEMPPALLELLMQQALEDPDFAHLRPPGR